MKILNKQNCDYELGLMLIENSIECAEMRDHELTRAPLFEYFTPNEELDHGNKWAILDTSYDQYIEHVCVRVKDYNRALDLYARLLEAEEGLDRMQRCMERATYAPTANDPKQQENQP